MHGGTIRHGICRSISYSSIHRLGCFCGSFIGNVNGNFDHYAYPIILNSSLLSRSGLPNPVALAPGAENGYLKAQEIIMAHNTLDSRVKSEEMEAKESSKLVDKRAVKEGVMCEGETELPGIARREGDTYPSAVEGALCEASKEDAEDCVEGQREEEEGGMKEAKLSDKAREKAPKALPGGEKADSSKDFPIPDKSHARDAKSGASHAEHVGNISKAQEKEINARADRKLAEADFIPEHYKNKNIGTVQEASQPMQGPPVFKHPGVLRDQAGRMSKGPNFADHYKNMGNLTFLD